MESCDLILTRSLLGSQENLFLVYLHKVCQARDMAYRVKDVQGYKTFKREGKRIKEKMLFNEAWGAMA